MGIKSGHGTPQHEETPTQQARATDSKLRGTGSSDITPHNDKVNSDSRVSDQSKTLRDAGTIPKTASPDQNNAAILDSRVKSLNGAPVSATYRTNDGQFPTAIESYNQTTKQIEVVMNNQRYERVAHEDPQGQKAYSLRPIDGQGKPTGGEAIGLAAVRTGKPPEGTSPEKYVTIPPTFQTKEFSPNSNNASGQSEKLEQGQAPAPAKDRQLAATSAAAAESVLPAAKKESSTEINSVNRTPVIETKPDAESSKFKSDQSQVKPISPSPQLERTVSDPRSHVLSLEHVKNEVTSNHLPAPERSLEPATKTFSAPKEVNELKTPNHESNNLEKVKSAPILDSKGNQVNVTNRVDFIDKISRPIQNLVGIQDGAHLIIVPAIAKILEGTKPGRNQPEGAASDKQIKGNKPEDVKVSKLEDLCKRVQKLPEVIKDRAIDICEKLIKNRSEKFDGKDAELADKLRRLDMTQLSVVKLIFLTGIRPDFSKFSPKLQTKLTDVFHTLIEQGRTVKGERTLPRSDKNLSQATDTKTAPISSNKSEKYSPNQSGRDARAPGVNTSTRVSDTNTRVSSQRPDPRGFIDSIVTRLQGQGILKPLSEVISKFKDSRVDLKEAKESKEPRQLKEPKTDVTRLISEKSSDKAHAGKENSTSLLDPKQMIEKLGETSTRVIQHNSPLAQRTYSPQEWSARQRETKTRQSQQGEESKQEPKKKPELISNDFIPAVVQSALERDIHEEQQVPIAEEVIDPAAILERTMKAKPSEAKDTEIEQRLREMRNKDKSKRRTRVRHTVKEGDTLKTISEGFFGNNSYAAIIYHVNREQIELQEHPDRSVAVLRLGTHMLMPEPDEIDAYEKQNISYDQIEFGGVLAAEIKVAKVKSEEDIQASTQALQIDYRKPIYEKLGDGVKIQEYEHLNETTLDQGIIVALKIKCGDKWSDVCIYKIYSTMAVRQQFTAAGKCKTTHLTLPPAKVKEMAKNEFRNCWTRMCDEYRS